MTTPGNKAFVERLAKTPHTIKPDLLAREPKAPVVDLADKLQKQGLAVEAILPGHGRVGTLADLTAALAVKMPAN